MILNIILFLLLNYSIIDYNINSFPFNKNIIIVTPRMKALTQWQ